MMWRSLEFIQLAIGNNYISEQGHSMIPHKPERMRPKKKRNQLNQLGRKNNVRMTDVGHLD